MTNATAPARRFTHIVVYNGGATSWNAMALTTAEARSTRRSMREDRRPDVKVIHTYHHVLAAYVRADRSATRADKTLRGLWCGGWREWTPAAEEMWQSRSEAAHAKLDYYGPLLDLLETAERNVKVA
jgi:hypothetical protein